MTKKPTHDAMISDPLDDSGQPNSLRDDVDALEKREGRRDIGHRPLHQLALFQALQEFVHT